MKNLELVKERYLKETLPRKIGALASNLARIASFSENPSNKKAVESLLEESKFFIEWVAPETSLELQSFFVQMQIKLSLWQRDWIKESSNFSALKQLRETTQHWADYLIKTSGLLSK